MTRQKVLVKLISALCVVTLLLSQCGCTGRDSQADKMREEAEAFVYQNAEIYAADEDSVKSISANGKGEIAIYDAAKGAIVIKDQEGKALREIPHKAQGYTNLAYDINNNLYVLVENVDKNQQNEVTGLSRQLFIYDSTGKQINDNNSVEVKQNRSIDKAELLKLLIQKIEIDSKGNIYALKANKEAVMLNSKLEEISTLTARKCDDIAIDENDNIIALLSYGNSSGTAIEKVQANKHKTIWKKTYQELQLPYSLYYNKSTKAIYSIGDDYIVKYDAEGNISNKLAKKEELIDVKNVGRIIVEGKDDLYIWSFGDGKARVLKYVKAEKEAEAAAKTEKKVIVLGGYFPWSDINSRDMANLVLKYERQHPDIEIKLVNYNGEFNTQNGHSQYIQRLNAELLSGKGPDILAGYFPAVEYIDKGILADLDEIIRQDSSFDLEAYEASIIDASRYKDTLYNFPAVYLMQLYLVNQEILDKSDVKLPDAFTWADYYNAMKKVRSKNKKVYSIPRFEGEPYIELDNAVFRNLRCYIDFDGKKASFDSKEFIDALKLVKSLKDNGYMHPDINMYGHPHKEDYRESIVFIPVYNGSIQNLSSMSRLMKDYIIMPPPVQGARDAVPFIGYNLSINNTSKYKKEAWDFIKYVLSEEAQLYLSEGYYAVNNKAYEQRIDIYLKQLNSTRESIKGTNREYYIVRTKELVEKSLNDNNSLLVPYELSAIVWNEVISYLNNERSAEETAKLIQNKADLYLKE